MGTLPDGSCNPGVSRSLLWSRGGALTCHTSRVLCLPTLSPGPSRTQGSQEVHSGHVHTHMYAAAWTVPTGEGRAHAPAVSSATTRAPRTHRTSARFSRTYGTRSGHFLDRDQPAVTQAYRSELGPARGKSTTGSGRGVGQLSFSQMPHVAPAPDPDGGRTTSEPARGKPVANPLPSRSSLRPASGSPLPSARFTSSRKKIQWPFRRPRCRKGIVRVRIRTWLGGTIRTPTYEHVLS